MRRSNALIAFLVVLTLAQHYMPLHASSQAGLFDARKVSRLVKAAIPKFTLLSRRHHDSGTEFPIKDEETIRKTFTLPAGQNHLEVNNVFGSIHVVAGSSDQVQLVVQKTIRAESKDRVETAKKEVTLDISQDNQLLKLYVNGPFRCNCNSGDCVHFDSDSAGYIVKMDFELQVPRNLELVLKTVNDGDIKVQGVTGKYSVHNVNGSIEMLDMAGSGRVRTVNGEVKVSFRENPRENSEFASLNGNVELRFADKLSADFRFKTFNGGIFSDYTMSSLPQLPAAGERENGKFVYRSDRYTGGRVGTGGPEIKVENLNGDIRILQSHV